MVPLYLFIAAVIMAFATGFFTGANRERVLMDDPYCEESDIADSGIDDPMKGYAAPNVLWEIRRERERQIAKGYDRKHDDEHKWGEIATAAAHYAGLGTPNWPWGWDSRPDLNAMRSRDRMIIAAALCVAEIERLDRAAVRAEEAVSLPEYDGGGAA